MKLTVLCEVDSKSVVIIASPLGLAQRNGKGN